MEEQQPQEASAGRTEADVIVVGAGPGGSAAAAHLAQAGLDVIVLEKSRFPREKVCGDGLTPRAVRELVKLGIDTSPEAGWKRHRGLRIYGGRVEPFEMPWPDLADFPPYGLVRPRADFDDLLARHARQAGAVVYEGQTVTGPVADASGRVTGVTTRTATYRAPVVVAADGNSSRLAVQLGRPKRDDRPLGVAVRTYYTSPRHDSEWLESWLELWDGQPGRSRLLPGYGWVFPMGDGTCNVGLGMLNTAQSFGRTDYKDLLRRWLDATPDEWQFREEFRTTEVRGAALPMGFNRTPAYDRGLLLVGDAGGMVNPFNGEGISYAMESGRYAAAHIADAHARGVGSRSAERALLAYNQTLRSAWGGYFRLGGVFVKLIGDPRVMHLCTRYGLPRRRLMLLVHRLLANLTDRPSRDGYDRIVNTLTALAPPA
ncbi:MAG: geranylgeranyl reductase family protein [Actinomycetia bacterium]|nr:geranylgeranyl reductase family protein [Actinomycetes bacterium]